MRTVSGHEPSVARLQHPTVGTGLGMRWLGKDTVPVRTRGGHSQPGPSTQQCVQYLPLEGDLMEEFGELLCQDTIPAGEHKNQDKE